MEINLKFDDGQLETLIKSAVYGRRRPEKMLSELVLHAVGARVEAVVTEHMGRTGFDALVRKKCDEMLDACIKELVQGYAQARLKAMVEIDGDAKMNIIGKVTQEKRRDAHGAEPAAGERAA